MREFLISKDTPPVPSEVKATPQWMELNRLAGSLSRVEKQNKAEIDVIKQAKDAFSKAEAAFRKMITGRLAREFPFEEARLEALRHNRDWQWLGKMYPVAFLQERRVICMSVDKFFLPLDTITGGSILLYNSQVIEGNTVFIDEVDATKETLTNRIIEDATKIRVDQLVLFLSIYSVLNVMNFTSRLMLCSQKTKEARRCSPWDVVADCKSKACEVFEQFSLNFGFKTQGALGARNFLFNDFRYISVLDGGAHFANVETSEADSVNKIILSQTKYQAIEDDNHYGIPVMLGRVHGFISYFRGAVWQLARNYMEVKSEESDAGGKVVFPLEQAIRTVLREFKLSQEHEDYLVRRVLGDEHTPSHKKDKQRLDLSFWESGFRYYAFEDSLSHDTLSSVMASTFDITPEKRLLTLCKRAKVVGISATASVPTVTGNYDVGYLETQLGDDFVRPDKAARERIAKDFYVANDYSGVRVNVQLIDAGEVYSRKTWESVFTNKESACIAYDRIARESGADHIGKRYFRIAVAFKRFLEEKEILSFLCILTKHPREGDRDLNIDVLRDLFELVAQEVDCLFNVKEQVEQLKAADYDDKKDEILQRLGKGQKLFVISTYQTLGAGQNLQYTIPKNLKGKLVKTGRRESDQKDFDAIYLDKPTNLLVNLNDTSQPFDEENLMRRLFQVECLQEAGDLSSDAARDEIKATFTRYAPEGKNDSQGTDLYQCPSVKRHATLKVIQAVGRICRTCNKSPNVWVFADSGLAGRVDPSLVKHGLYNTEVTELFKTLEPLTLPPVPTPPENKAITASRRASEFIRKQLGSQWNRHSIEQWQEIRRSVLTFPTMTREEAKRNRFADLYVTLPSQDTPLYYTQQEDYTHVQVFFTKPAVADVQQVCEKAARLDKLMSYPDLRQWFKAQGFATTFGAGKMVMSPPLFNNIYKGALGEVCGKWFFDRLADVKLEEITDDAAFEVFDFKVAGKAVYVDFKNWAAATDFEEAEMLKKIQDKAGRIGARGVVVANIFHAQGDTKRIYEDPLDGVRLLRVPALLAGEDVITTVEDAFEAIVRFIQDFKLEGSDEQDKECERPTEA